VDTEGTMNITFCCTGTPDAPWLAALRDALPGAQINTWQPGAPQADYAVVWAPPEQFFSEQRRLKAAFNIGAGVNALLSVANVPQHTRLFRLEDAGMAAQMAEYVLHAIVRHFRQFARYEAQQSQGRWLPHRAAKRSEFAVGIMGLGVLGTRVAEALKTLDFPLRGYSLSRKNLSGIDCYAGPNEFEHFARGLRALVCVLPLTPATEDIINAQTLEMLAPRAYIVNVARGAHVVEQDLLAAVHSGHIAGATLDVFREEPLPAEHPFWKEKTIHITPHISAATLLYESVAQIAGKLRALERGERVSGEVDRSRGY
jgi:glyoxylate/hydroxypyruvate reductase A